MFINRYIFLFLFCFVVNIDTSFAQNTFQQDLDLAILGNSGAEYRIGSRYLNGEGIEQDYTKALYWLEKAAAQNHANALYNLGYMYLYGYGVKTDYMMAFDYFESAKNLNFLPAYYIIGIMYYDGAGVKKNDKKAYEYCKIAIENGYKTSNITLDHENKKIIINK